MLLPVDLAEKIKAARLAAGLSQGAAARRVGVSIRGWGDWERGHTVPSRPTLAKIEEAFGRELDAPIPDPAEKTHLDPYDTLADYVKQAMGARGLDTISDLSERCGIAMQTASNIINNRGRQSEETLAKVAAGLDQPVANLLLLANRREMTQDPWVPPAVSAQLPPGIKVALDQLIISVAAHFPDPARKD